MRDTVEHKNSKPSMHCNSLEMEAFSLHTGELHFLFPHLRNKAPSLTNNAPAVSRTAKQGRTYKAERSFASAHQFHRTRQLIPFTWKTISTRSDIINAMFKLSNPAAQNPLGIVPGFDTPDATESDHSCPPLAHSHRILSFLQRNGIPNHPLWGWIQGKWEENSPPLELHNHYDGSNRRNHNHKWP